MSLLIEATGLRKSYGDFTAVAEISFAVKPGEIVGFLGPNGAGKTTTLKMLTGLLQADAGTVLIDGHDMQTDPLSAKAALGYVPDTPNLYGKLKAIEYLRFIGQLYHVPRATAERRIQRFLELFDLANQAGNLLDSYSHGMQQKIAIAGALLHNPNIILLDEPTGGLDPKSARLIKELMVQRRDGGQSVLFSTHILEIAQHMCDRVIIINRGEILADAAVDELRRIKGEQSLEDIFLELTSDGNMDAMVRELADDT